MNKILSKERSQVVNKPAHRGYGNKCGPLSQWLIDYFPFSLKKLHDLAESSELAFGDTSPPSPQKAGFLIKSNIFYFYQHLPLKY